MFNDFLSLFFPKLCEACAEPLVKGEDIVCSSCLLNLPRTNSHIYKSDKLNSKFYGKVDIQQTMSFMYFRKDGPVQNLLHSLKYRNKPQIGTFIGKLFGSELRQNSSLQLNYDIIIPVPLHKSRLRRRGYNQSEFFANGLSESLNITVNTKDFVRTAKSTTQTKKNRLERWENVKDIFEVKHPVNIENKRVLLVDDVITTGATVEACAVKLYSAGAKEVAVATIAMAV